MAHGLSTRKLKRFKSSRAFQKWLESPESPYRTVDPVLDWLKSFGLYPPDDFWFYSSNKKQWMEHIVSDEKKHGRAYWLEQLKRARIKVRAARKEKS